MLLHILVGFDAKTINLKTGKPQGVFTSLVLPSSMVSQILKEEHPCPVSLPGDFLFYGKGSLRNNVVGMHICKTEIASRQTSFHFKSAEDKWAL